MMTYPIPCSVCGKVIELKEAIFMEDHKPYCPDCMPDEGYDPEDDR